jgi:hypothetical protein
MRARQNTGTVARHLAKDIGDAIDRDMMANIPQLRGQPAARCHIVRRQGRAMDAGLVSTNLTQFIEITQDPIRIRRRHSSTLAAIILL